MLFQGNVRLYLQLIDIVYQQSNIDEEEVLTIFDQALSSSIAADHKMAFSQRKLEFLEDFGSNVDK